MLSLRSLLDVLFILLLSTIVMLAYSAPVGAVETDLVRVAGGGLSPIHVSETRFLLIRPGELALDGEPVASLDEAIARLDARDVVLLVAAGRSVRHHEVMDIWSTLRARGVRVQLGAAPKEEEP